MAASPVPICAETTHAGSSFLDDSIGTRPSVPQTHHAARRRGYSFRTPTQPDIIDHTCHLSCLLKIPTIMICSRKLLLHAHRPPIPALQPRNRKQILPPHVSKYKVQHPQDIHIAFAANASSHHLPRLTPHTNSILLPVLSPPAVTTPASLSYNPSKIFQVPSMHILTPSLRPTRSRLLPRHCRYVHPRPPAQ